MCEFPCSGNSTFDHCGLTGGLPNRLGFAIQNLVDTQIDVSNAVPCDSKDVAAALERVIDRFTLHYWRVTAQDPVRKSEINALLIGKRSANPILNPLTLC
ncbi:hypothetical protein [Neopusillimonas aromaticivorans]|uniref:hypothetical protein n=1 Tax=Neopusillimonas aromaticivorans TaxID=2979868 RepID=UPI00259A4916|nr:hypothetical protein [Neopusillimonas aromaticivorans]WJJ93243.1 hypothetical protein N7E01_14655 [Neopusillimonas aromaticivorans]